MPAASGGPDSLPPARAGFYKSPWGQHLRLQLITVGELLAGKKLDMPAAGAYVTQAALPPTPDVKVHPDQLALGPNDSTDPLPI